MGLVHKVMAVATFVALVQILSSTTQLVIVLKGAKK